MTITDSLGNDVTLDAAPERIVSLTPAGTEILFALGLGDRVVGVDVFSYYPEEAAALPQVGDYSGPATEAIVALQPDLILAGNTLQGEAISSLTELGLTVAAIEATAWEGIDDSILLIGRITGAEDAAASLVADMAAAQQTVTEAVAGKEPVSCYYVMSYGEFGNWTAGPGSFIDDMVTLAGGRLITHDAPAAWLEYSLEQIVAADPQVLLLSSDMGTADGLDTADGYKDLAAVKDNRVVVLPSDISTRPGPRITQALELIARALHPEAFAE
jgi:iron complex transport system substrate-binding protein